MSEQGSYQQAQQTVSNVNADEAARKVADYEKTSGIIWIAFGVLQVFSVFAIIAGIWNIFAGISRYKISKNDKGA